METMNKKGICYGVGIGPGDPELLTLKAARVLKECTVIATPQTRSGETLALDIARGAVDLSGKTILPLHFTMDRDRAVQHTAHVKAAEAIRTELDRGIDVAMLNLGDVSVYATWCYVMDILNEWGYETVMIPGITSFCATAARLGISLTDMDSTIHIAPGSRPMDEILSLDGTKILMKSGKQLPEVIEALRGRDLLEKSALVRNCGLPGEAVYPDLSQAVPDAGAGYFVTMIVKE